MSPLLAPELRAIKNMGIKPNYSALSKKYGMDRHTVKAMYHRLDSPSPERKAKPFCSYSNFKHYVRKNGLGPPSQTPPAPAL